MNRPLLLTGALLLLPMMAVTAAVLLRQLAAEKRLAMRLLALRQGGGQGPRPLLVDGGVGAAKLVHVLGTMIARSGILSKGTVEALQETLTVAGLRGSNALGMFVGSKLVLLVVLPLIAAATLPALGLAPVVQECSIAGAAVVGLLLPDWLVAHRRARYLKAVAAGLPDALDMMVICAEAGLGLEPALSRVGREIDHAHPAIAAEFARTVSELRVSADTAEALAQMGARTGLIGLKRVAAVLAQTMKYGTPLGQALRVLSAEMRQETLIRFEARAARLPVLLTLPMIVFILPCIFLIVGGPAFVQGMRLIQH